MLPVNSNVSSLFPTIIDELIVVEECPVTANLSLPNSQLIVPNLNTAITEVDLLLAGISGRAPLPPGLLVLLIRLTSLNKAAGRERIFTMAFPILYPTGRADFNAARQRKVDLNNYARYLICYYNRRFGEYSR
jgi:hypothetical protein